MDTNSANEDDVNDLERRLSGWRPSVEGLSREAMLFAAGLAAARSGRGRVVWPALASVLAISAAALFVWGLSERAENQLLLSQFREARRPASSPDASPIVASAGVSQLKDVTQPDSYINVRRRLEREPGLRLALGQSTGPLSIGAAPPEPAILRASEYEALFHQ